ncbi:MAG TPA: DUF3857 domain-containing protein [Bryobacteraceae bacterium]|nr:DUF3857 domain-containing protein [Bryobacteraceae bacterium]
MRLFYTVLWCSLLVIPSLRATIWRPITPEELALKKSKADPNADAEGLFREVRVLNEMGGSTYPHNVISEYIRLKIFTDRGKDKYGTVQIPYAGKSTVYAVTGRTIRPDGSVVELSKDAIFDRVIVKKSGRKTKAISFAMPAVGPGAIIEYSWSTNPGEFISRYLPLEVQQEFPIDEVTFHIKPMTSQYVAWPAMRYMPFRCNVDPPGRDREGFAVLTIHNVPAFHEELFMPPEFSAKQWVLVYYEENSKNNSDQYWKGVGRGIYSDYNQKIKINGDVKSIAAAATANAKTDEEKIARLVDYCRTKLKDVNGRNISTEEREAAKMNKNTVDVLKRGVGNSEDINYAFAALATASGFEARLAKLSDRGTFLFDPVMRSAFFLNSYDIAVRLNDKWKFYDVTNPNLPAGVLSWREEGVPALIADPKDPEFVTTPLFSSQESKIARFADLKLSSEGVLEGDIREIRMGNRAAEWREQFASMNDAEREDDLRQELKARFAEFEMSEAKFSGTEDVTKAVGLRYHVKVEGYAQRSGKRLFVTPAFFEAALGARFTAAKRELPIYFPYPWSENDVVTIQMPEGYTLDHADAPAPLPFAPIGNYAVKIFVKQPNNVLEYHRDLVFGSDKVLLFDTGAYPAVKEIFDRIHQADAHMLTLKTDATAQ